MVEERQNSAVAQGQPIAFGRRLAGSEAFRAMFKEGMALVEETASYLDGAGREESRRLSRAASLAYASESMRLTTRLMQLASWLLLQRAVNDGEMSAEQANNEKAKVKLGGLATATDGPGWEGLPERLRGLILRSVRLQERVRKLDGAIEGSLAAEAENPVRSQIGRLAREFARRQA
jgi:regulator of CtrA degradation